MLKEADFAEVVAGVQAFDLLLAFAHLQGAVEDEEEPDVRFTLLQHLRAGSVALAAAFLGVAQKIVEGPPAQDREAAEEGRALQQLAHMFAAHWADDELVEVRLAQAQQLAGPRGADRGRARGVIEERDLAEAVAGVQPADGLRALRGRRQFLAHLELAFHHHIECVTRIVLVEDDLLAGDVHRRHGGGEGLEVVVAQSTEEWHAAQRGRVVAGVERGGVDAGRVHAQRFCERPAHQPVADERPEEHEDGDRRHGGDDIERIVEVVVEAALRTEQAPDGDVESGPGPLQREAEQARPDHGPRDPQHPEARRAARPPDLEARPEVLLARLEKETTGDAEHLRIEDAAQPLPRGAARNGRQQVEHTGEHGREPCRLEPGSSGGSGQHRRQAHQRDRAFAGRPAQGGLGRVDAEMRPQPSPVQPRGAHFTAGAGDHARGQGLAQAQERAGRQPAPEQAEIPVRGDPGLGSDDQRARGEEQHRSH